MVVGRVGLVIAAVIATPVSAVAGERLVRRADDVGHVTALAQSRDGELWMGTASGLLRHDGRAWVPVARDVVRSTIARLAVHRDGLIAVEELATAWWLPRDGSAPRPLTDDTGRGIVGPVGTAIGPSGTAWIVGEHGVWTGEPLALRRVSVPAAMIDELPRVVTIAADGRAFVATRRGLWRVTADGTAERLADAPPPAAMLVEGDGVYHLAWGGALTRWAGGELAPVFELDPRTTRARRGISLARRGATLWVSYDLALVALRPGREPEILTSANEIPSGGPLLVDDEGTLLLGTFRGLRLLPEPETLAFTEDDGMPSNHGRFAAVTAEGAWLATWQGLGLVRPGASRAEPIDVPDTAVREPMCVDGAGRLWSGAARHLFMRDRGVTRLIDVGDADFHDCVVEGARVWIGSDAGVFLIEHHASAPVRVATPPVDAGGAPRAEQLALDQRGRLWIARGAEVCVVALSAADDARAWTCVTVPAAKRISDLWATPSNTVWFTARPGGLFRVVEGDGQPLRGEPLPGLAGMTGELASTLAPSPRGGVWVSTSGAPVRVVEALGAGDGWRVVERLGPWQGLIGGTVTHVAETPGGDLWLASFAGLISIPAGARAGPPSPPAVDIVDLRGDGRPAPASARVRLAAGANAIELGFAARTRRAPELVRYRVRIGGGAWSPARTTAELQLLDLPSGSRGIEVAASLDGETWGPVARLTVDVDTPWFRRSWVWVAAAALVAVMLGLIHRARVATHVRLERQRLRIAMDLHDEMGSGLGSIGVLACVAGELDADAAGRREVAATIAATAADLGTALGDIVWSLRPKACTLDELAQRLRTRAAATFAAGDVVLVLQLDGLPAVAVSPATARAVQLVGHEAIYNAARHARARRVAVGLAPRGGRRWSLWIEDDGVGVGDAGDGGGVGLTSMRRRARAIGAKLTIAAGAGGRGTRVELHFHLDAEDQRVLQRIVGVERWRS